MFDLIFSLAGHGTGRLVLTIMSGGTIRVQGPVTDVDDAFPWHGFRRDPDGTLKASEQTAELIGVLTWVIIAIAAVLAFGRL